MKRIASGVYLEGLCTGDSSVWVADPIKGGVRRIQDDGTVQAWLPDKRWIGSLLRGEDDIVLISGERGIVWLDGATGETGTLIETVGGVALPGVNEMIADARGAIYFGGNDIAAIAAGRRTEPVAIYRRDADGTAAKLVDGLRFTNGIGLSPDGRRLYCNETFVGTVAFDLASDGTLGAMTRLLDKPDCDGLAVDRDGILWITGCQTPAIVRLAPDGHLAEPLPVPAGGATNVRFGGADRRDLFVTCVAEGAAMKLAAGIWPQEEESFLYKGRSDVPGLAIARAAVASAIRAERNNRDA